MRLSKSSSTPRWIAATACLVLAASACSSEVTDGNGKNLNPDDQSEDELALHEDLEEQLAGCGVSSCGSWHTYGGPILDDLACMVDSLLAGERFHVAIGDGPDGAICGKIHDIYVSEEGEVQIAYRADNNCDSETEFDTRDTWSCQLKGDREVLEGCKAELEAGESANDGFAIGASCWHFDAFVTACQSVEQASCF